VYRAPESDFRLTWFDRRGVELGRVGTPARFAGLALSPKADRALVSTAGTAGDGKTRISGCSTSCAAQRRSA
jgi:hypothetical protein